MTGKGKHASRTPATFYRDLAIMIGGILVVGAAVFFLLYLFADDPGTGPTTLPLGAETTSTGGETTTTPPDITTTTVPATTTSTQVPVRPPSEVTVQVLNSIGIDGAAGRLTSDLGAAGYQTVSPDNFEPEQDPSRIWYREGFAAEASSLLEFMPGATVEPIPDDTIGEGADIVMVLGTGYQE